MYRPDAGESERLPKLHTERRTTAGDPTGIFPRPPRRVRGSRGLSPEDYYRANFIVTPLPLS